MCRAGEGNGCSPDGVTFNQIDLVIIDRRHASDILKIDSRRGPDCDSDYYLVRVKYRQHIAIYRSTGKEKAPRRYNATKLKEKTTAQQYEAELETYQVNWKRESVEGKWNIINNVLQETADEVLGVKDREKRQGWFNEECREIIKKSNEARRKMTERKTRTNVEQLRQKRKEADKLCRRKKRFWEEEWITELEEQHNTQEVRKFYTNI
ncbi:hypothetical protein J437_LFUL013849 [Ladona fulva]|uniref:Uncharacterized protein n=1 Tax=Ladona fulva TaxID=123851 RepID=A0A8K0KGH0_LADFU|nr:hypothetical protein J437_LFUL013849 [Ladona fulva]